MRKLILAAILGTVGLQPMVSYAASAGENFVVDVTLTSACSITTPSDVVFTYTSFGAAQVSTGGDFSVSCTATLPYAFTLHNNAGVTAGGTPTINGTVVGLNYTLTAPPQVTGSGARQITGSMIAGQAGTCALAACNGTATHSLIITY
jgi:spore coat protein U-like protein